MLRAWWRNTKYQFYNLWFDVVRVKPIIHRTQDEHTNHYTTDAVIKDWLALNQDNVSE
jgi:hypothetical protein